MDCMNVLWVIAVADCCAAICAGAAGIYVAIKEIARLLCDVRKSGTNSLNDRSDRHNKRQED